MNKIHEFISIYSELPKGVYILFIAKIINSLGNFILPFLTLFLTDKLSFSVQNTGEILLVNSVFLGFGSIRGGKLADYFGRKKLLLLSFVLFFFFLATVDRTDPKTSFVANLASL